MELEIKFYSTKPERVTQYSYKRCQVARVLVNAPVLTIFFFCCLKNIFCNGTYQVLIKCKSLLVHLKLTQSFSVDVFCNCV